MTVNPETASARSLLPEPAIQRLPWYLAYVSQLRAAGVEQVSSKQISKFLNVDASQIAKDLSYLNVKGKTGIGYDVVRLENALNDFLGFQKVHRAAILGVGSLGAALMSDSGLSCYGLDIIAGFDIEPKASVDGIPVFNINDLSEKVKELGLQIGILTVPHDVAQSVADKAIDAGISAIWNFTPHRLKPRAGVVIQDTSLYSHLAVMYNRLEQNCAK
ncbi:MAG: redox-sensing transcriptional repressor Rex [Bacteroides sp.]|nr:redox-sensing transcriptional repressor Rex [Bacteroides sp.]MCM1379754.1 redox-sensing transcriptional repressor Rex [Bacteroides sp.]MCM1445705.1 redox-sensing transcriptional repressor Rex [Prevotella sp.]